MRLSLVEEHRFFLRFTAQAWRRGGGMTIIVEGVALAALPDSVEGLMERFPTLWHEAVKLSGRPARRVETGQAGVLYVTQKEYAVVDRADERIELVGSDDGTTRHLRRKI